MNTLASELVQIVDRAADHSAPLEYLIRDYLGHLQDHLKQITTAQA